MATIDKLDISIYNLYAIRTKMIEDTNQQLRLKEAGGVTAHIQILDFYPKLTELDLLLGVGTVLTPWALFLPPKKFKRIRRSPFTFSRIVPSFGSLEDHDEILETLDSVQTHTPSEEREKAAIESCLDEIEKINSWLGHIIGRIGQFLQG